MLSARAVIGLTVLVCHAERLPIRAYTTAEGLAHNQVNRIYRDSHNFLWICTDDGLSRFDGRRFVNYTVANGLPHMHVDEIIEARNGGYWIATDGGLARFRSDARPPIARVNFPDAPPQARFVNAVLEDSDGAVLLGTAAGLYRLAGERMERVNFPSPPGVAETDLVNTLYLNGQGLWVGAATGLYWRNPGGKWARFDTRHGLPHDFVDRIVSDREGRVWLCTRHGLARLAQNPQADGEVVDLTLTRSNGLPHPDVRFIWFSADGRRWIGTHGGLVEWSGVANFHVYTESNGLTDRWIRAITEDPQGNLWLGANRGGLMRLARAGFQKFDAADGLSLGTDDGTVVETRSGAICVAEIGTPRRPFHCYDGSRFETTFPRLPADVLALIPTSSQATIQDHFGDWWLSSGRGTLRFRGGSLDLRLLPDRDSRSLYEDSRGDLWITTNSSRGFGLMRWERATRRLHDYAGSLPPAVRVQNINVVSEAPPGQIWIGLTSPGGLFRLRGHRFEPLDGAPEGSITALYPDRSHRLWIATLEAGLGRIDHPDADRPVLRFYTHSQGLSANEVWTVTADREGRLYAGTYRGVDRLDPVTDRITHYSAADGLIPGTISTALTDRNGKLWFLSNRGLSRLDPAERPRSTPLARITGIRVAGEPYPISELGETSIGPLKFPSSRNSIQVEYSAVDYSSDEIQYEFRLDGGGKTWSGPDPNPAVQFANLAPGGYRFKVRAAGSDAAATLSFSITPPIWRRWWFQLATVVSMAAAAALWQRSRLRRQLALERVRAHIATDLHDDIGASLSRIAMMSEVLKTGMNTDGAGSQHALGQIADESRRLVGDMSDIVWSIDPRRDTMGDLVARLRSFGSGVLEPRGIRWTFDAGEYVLKHKLSPDQRRQLYLVVKEAIHNIARHSAASQAAVRIGIEGHLVWCDIEDDGRGLPLDSHNGLGIHSMHLRAKRLGGRFEVVARPGGGTRATLRFPLSKKNA
jgi:ligand-binding sensor domain-containing protein/signal transduction histidine kinase